MRDTVRRTYRPVVAVLALGTVLVGLLLALAAPAQAAAAPAATRIRLSVVPTGPIPSPGQVSLIARVTPSDAAGRVLFSIKRDAADPITLNTRVTDGLAQVDKVGFTRNGRYVIMATFEPDDASAFDSSTSAPRVLIVSPTPTMRLFTTSGVEVTANTAVSPREQLVAQLSGFPARTRATLRWDRRVLVPTVPLDAAGGGTAILTLPARLGGGRHVLSATVGQVRTSVVLLSSSPESTISTRVGTPETEVPETGGGEPTVNVPSSGGGSLAHTGANPLPVASAAGLLLVLGGGMVVAGRPVPRRRGRHCVEQAAR